MKKTRIYHITSLRNLSEIWQHDGLYCKHELQKRGIEARNIAYETLQDRRAHLEVPLSPQGVLHDYVPWSFARRSPMLCAIAHNRVAQQPPIVQEEIIYLVAYVEEIVAQNLSFVFTDGHPLIRLSQFFDSLAELENVDWPLMESRYWRNTPDDPDRKRRRQAEFLIHRFVPCALIRGVATMNEDSALQVQQLLENSTQQPSVACRPDWYY